MKHNNLIDRREFTLEAALAVLSGVAITITGCGGSTTPTSPSFNASDDVRGTISANHGHTAVITRATLMDNNAISLNIRGIADHTHTVELSQSDIAAIAAGQRVSRVSSPEQAHDHTVSFN